MNEQLKPTAPNVTMIDSISEQQNESLKYAVYVRVSSNSEEQLNSYAAQISHYTRMFREHNEWQLIDIYADEGITGTSLAKREDFQRMIMDCRLGKIDRIITKSVSRFSRDHVTTIATIRELMRIGVSVYFEDDDMDTKTMQSETLLNLQSMLAEQGSRTISKNAHQGFVMRAKNGHFKQSKKPFGYDLVDNQLVINPYEAEIVREIFDDYLNGKSMTEIAKELTNRKVVKTSGKEKWHHSAIRMILGNERYIGDRLLQKKFSTNTIPIRKKINKGFLDQYYIEDSHEPIISKETFAKVDVLMEQRKKDKTLMPVNENHYLSKKMRCSECGKTLKRKTVNHISYWACTGRDKGETDCDVTQLPELEIEKAFMRIYNRLQQGKDKMIVPMLQMLSELRKAQNQSNDKFDEIKNQIDEISEQSHMLSSLKAKGIIDSAFAISQQNELNHKLAKLRKAKEQLLMENENDTDLANTKILLMILESNKTVMIKFDESVFKSIVKNTTALPKNKITFHFINGLSITEKVERNKR